MTNKKSNPDAEKKYLEAHDMHYGKKDLFAALDIYELIINDHADSAEAGFSLSQIQNIVNSVVPKDELLDAHLKMVRLILSKNEAS